MKVMVDPGHHGYYVNQSPVDSSYYESATVWVLGNYVAEELRKLGVLASLTRTNIEEDPPLVDRGQSAVGYDLFVSIHTNATGNNKGSEGVNWPVCYVQLSGASTEIGTRIAKALMPLFNATEYECYPRKNDNGQDWHAVLRGATSVGVPGVIIEHGFHTCKADVELLKQDSFLRKLAQTDAKVIYDYLKEREKQVVINPSSNTLYGRVKGVPEGDVLNVRIGPGSTFDRLKENPSLGNGNLIDIFGRDDSQKWLYVRIRTQSGGYVFGWVSRAYIELT